MEYYYFLIIPIIYIIIEISKNYRFKNYTKIYKADSIDKLIEYEKHSKKININEP
jgi:hypothetical protein